MKEIIVYVEGAADKLSMEVLLNPLIQEKLAQGVAINFFETVEGDRKQSLLVKAPIRAVNILQGKPNAIVVLMPDLYPPNKGFPHTTFNEMKDGILKNFEHAMQQKNLKDERLFERLKIFCFKYDLEALLLAVPKALALVLEREELKPTWKIPVENQNHNKPPKKIIETLFAETGQRYIETRDAPNILGQVNYEEVANACSQCFKPFVDFVRNL